MGETKEIKEKRLSNFELLRIVAMILIILHHYAYHGNLISVANDNVNKYIALFIILGGKLGVDIFVLITGYFQVDAKFKFKKIISLILQVYFYSIFLFLIDSMIKGYANKYIFKQAAIFALPKYWFAMAYIILYVNTPLINIIVKRISKINFRIILIIMFGYICILPLILGCRTIFNCDYFTFIFLYLIGAYIKIYDIKFKTYWNKILMIINMILITAIYNIPRAFGNPGETCRNYIMYSEEFLPIFFTAIMIFLCFKGLKIKYNKTINRIAKMSFGVYLLHDNEFFRDYLWNNILHVKEFYNANPIVLILHIIGSIIFIYGVTFILEEIIELGKKIISNCIGGKNEKIIYRKH